MSARRWSTSAIGCARAAGRRAAVCWARKGSPAWRGGEGGESDGSERDGAGLAEEGNGGGASDLRALRWGCLAAAPCFRWHRGGREQRPVRWTGRCVEAGAHGSSPHSEQHPRV